MKNSFVFLLVILVLAGTVFAYVLTQDQYRHVPPERDCSQPYAYPMCERAHEPLPASEPPLQARYLGMLFVAVLAVILTVLSFESAVMSQRDLNVTARTARTADVRTGTPAAIPRNTVRPEEVQRDA